MTAAVASIVPPSDLDAEGIVLSACLLNGNGCVAEIRMLLKPFCFYSDANRRIYEAILELDAEGKPVDIVLVAGRLRDAGRLQQVGGTPYLAQLSEATPAVANVIEHAQVIVEHRRRREALTFGRQMAAEAYGDVGDLSAWLAEKQSELARVVETGAPRTMVWPSQGVDHIFAELPPIPYVVQALDLCAGAPALLAAYGYSGKTLMMQAALLAIASGLPVWGTFAAKQGRCLHVDFEQGSHLTRERYQRLAAGMLIAPSDVAGRLELVTMPQLYLDAPGLSDALARRLEGFDLVVIDSLRAACPSLDENDSGARVPLDALTRASEKTGAAVVVIHHARKPSRDAAGGAKMTIRGSGAIFDACSSVLVLDAAKGEPTRVSHEKARVSGRLADDFLLRIEDVEHHGNPRGALVVTAEAAPRPGAQSGRGADTLARLRLEDLTGRILALLADGPQPGRTALRAHLGAKRDDVWAALDLLIQRGLVRETGSTNQRRLELVKA